MSAWEAAPRWSKALAWATLALAGACVYAVGWAAGWSLEAQHDVGLGAAMVGGSNLALALVSAPAAVAWGVVVARTWRALEGATLRLAPLAIWAWCVTGMLRGAYYGSARAAPMLDLWDLSAVIMTARVVEAAVPIVALYPALLALGFSPAHSRGNLALASLLGGFGYVTLVLLLI